MYLNIYNNISRVAIVSVICLSSFVSNAELPNNMMQSKVNAISQNIINNVDGAIPSGSNNRSNLIRNKRQLNPLERSQLSKPARVINVKRKNNRRAIISDVDQQASAEFVSSVTKRRSQLDAEEQALTGN